MQSASLALRPQTRLTLGRVIDVDMALEIRLDGPSKEVDVEGCLDQTDTMT